MHTTLSCADGEKLAGRGKQPFGLDRCVRADNQNIALFSLFYGEVGIPESLEALDAMGRLREPRPELITIYIYVGRRMGRYEFPLHRGRRRAIGAPFGRYQIVWERATLRVKL